MNTSNPSNTRPATQEWIGEAMTGHLRMIDQTQLPNVLTHLELHDVEGVWQAIKRLSVRGAPAIGIAAAYGCVIAARTGKLAEGIEYLATSRPTAVNLFWALDRIKALDTEDPSAILKETILIHQEDEAMCQAIGKHGLEIIPEGGAVLTHCNAGALATGGIGTATAPMYLAHQKGRSFKVYADETRPLLQGSRLTSWELSQAGIDVTVICDDMAPTVMKEGKIDAVITGADRVTARGDAANKIGTYGLAILAKFHEIPFYIAAPSSTFDFKLISGDDIPIEERAPIEIINGFGKATAPEQIQTYNPAFDVTPAELITGLITEKGMIQPVTEANIRKTLEIS